MSKTKTSLDEEFAKLKEDEETEWWRPTKRDNFNLTNKLMRSGCRSLNRKYIRCLREGEEGFAECQQIKSELDKCLQLTQYVYAVKAE